MIKVHWKCDKPGFFTLRAEGIPPHVKITASYCIKRGTRCSLHVDGTLYEFLDGVQVDLVLAGYAQGWADRGKAKTE